ncbi:DUF1501 domain-containing protein [Arsenicicoccus dermatophilus]|uniref:DUF1501 domain-containing protein n=1 Tax=Arsenicicoccus dermatophilus TaxID=1076331 RepID=UPI001F4D05D6|nr:DUF1501 domain-containing protein [Arsenicicoccus dermatophilus]MCH8611653.1 DUF1501 domain-containing protein [Arsenicicoccus dermatophilus]
MTTPGRFEYLLHEDLVTPLHHHDGRLDGLVLHTAQGSRVAGPAEADAYVARHRPVASLAESDQLRDGPRIRRRAVLQGAVAGLGALVSPAATPRYSFAAGGSGQLLVVIFLRGGVDGLSAVAPVHDPMLGKNRPVLALRPEQAVMLDATYGMNPNLRALKPMYDARELAIVVGAGHPQVSRSHFEDQALVEHAAPASMRSGWLARHLQTSSSSTGTLRAITRGPRVAMSLTTTAFDTVAMADLGSFDLATDDLHKRMGGVTEALAGMYSRAGGPAAAKGSTMFGALESLRQARTSTPPVSAASFPVRADRHDDAFMAGLRDIARVARAGKGLEVACVDFNDWDMHHDAGRADQSDHWFARKSRVLAGSLVAFRAALGDLWSRTTVIAMSEFGRRVQENGSLGFDHGHGGLMMVLGGGIHGGRVYGAMPSLAPDHLPLGDLPVTTDYRQVLSEIVGNQLGNARNLGTVFPGFTPGEALGIA